MNRSPAKNVGRLILDYRSRTQTVTRPCDVFINHRGVDTKRSVAGLLYNHLTRLRLHPFLDSKSMKPGDKLFEKIDSAIRNCKVGVAVFSPHYCESYFCLHELALIMETKRKVIPIFCDVKPSELRVMDYGICPAKDLQRFSWALEEAKHTVGLTFDSLTGDWSDLVATASDSVIRNLIEVEEEQRYRYLGGAMNRSPAKNVGRLILDYWSRTQTVTRPCDVFINHRGVDTKRSVAGLLYNHLTMLRLHPFLDSKSMKPGDKLFEKIDSAIRNCKVGVAVFSPHYCESYFCLHELALIMETKRKVIPIFCDVKPSELRVMDYGICPAKDLQRFSWALEEAKHTVGFTFDSLTGDWSDLVATASDSVIRNLIEVEEEQRYRDWSDLVATASDSVIRNLIEVEEEQRYRCK
ncbi:hypothetical protein HHK36_001918 [Tetracentron sinense]|uniref:TIR domain-containing protein n=1 Tax=Tetracentron sinense TaxID=13715 RepID=A0A834ZWX7_TETSI|nr:hypothetical protein HHK36_001918 [Tetracentron sinense]